MQDLTQEEYALLSCNKEGWQKEQERYTRFIEILKRYIELWGTAISIDFNEMCFPEIIFDDALIANRGMQMRDCIFYGSVTFENIVFSDYVRINNCTYHSETIFQNLQFMKEIDWMGCTYKQKSLFSNIKFLDKLYFSGHFFESDTSFNQLKFHDDADFSRLELNKQCNIMDLKGIEFLKWDDLICAYNSPQCQWKDRELHFKNYFIEHPEDLKTFNFVNEIKEVFPEEVNRVNRKLIENDYGWSCYFFIEYFASITHEYLKKREYEKAKRHLDFFDKKIRISDKDTISLISIAYVENIMWQLTYKQQKEAWKHIPLSIQEEYKRVWSAPS